MKDIDDDAMPEEGLRVVGKYAKLSEARVRGLVVSAMTRPHWIQRNGKHFELKVEEADVQAVEEELAQFEAETVELNRQKAAETPLPPIPKTPLVCAGVAYALFFIAQLVMPPAWENEGSANGVRILAGQWWRTLSALTLHADFGHVAGNAAFSLVYAALAGTRLGYGVAWLLFVLSGALGNYVNAQFYALDRHDVHSAIGASTAVFGILGVMCAAETIGCLRKQSGYTGWRIIGPIGGGLALLGMFGAGDTGRIDFMGHFWGFVCGIPLGLLAGWLKTGETIPPKAQRNLAILAFALLLLPWIIIKAIEN